MRTAQPPYSHVLKSTHAELDGLGLTDLSAMVNVEPYCMSDVGGYPSDDDESLCSSSRDDPDDHGDANGTTDGEKKKKQ